MNSDREGYLRRKMWWLWEKRESGFSSSSTAEEVTQGIQGSGLTAIVTGGARGIGAETVRVLALRGVHVIMGVRNTAVGNRVKECLLRKNPDAKIDVMELDLSSMASVRKFCSNYSSSGLPLNILINNAGIMVPQFTLSEDNIELQFATNHVGHFLLTSLLLDTMKRTSVKTKIEGRIVNVSSLIHRIMNRRGIRFHKINDQFGYDYIFAYKQSKLANILHSNELARRMKEEGAEITANSVHPGFVTTSLYHELSFIHGLATKLLNTCAGKNVEQGAATTCYVALHPQVKGIRGEYFSNSNLDKASSLATNMDLAKKLWNFSEKLVK